MATKLKTCVFFSNYFRNLEYFVKQQVSDYLKERKLFPESEFAYRRQRSTEDAVVLAIKRWLMAKAERKYTGVVNVDTSKVFDSVRHARLVPVLFSFGLSGSALSCFSHYPSYS